MKRMLSILMSFLLLRSLALPAAAAETAATLRLEKTEGTVSVSNASGKSVTITKGMRLYSGYTISTEKDSYAYVSLDSTKVVKLDASSKAEVQKSGKKLELTATAGKLFFNVTAPVEKDESLNIRTSTMVTGVRGTSGWVEVTNRFTSRVHLLEGTLTVTSSEPATGQMRQATITGGQTATATLKGLDQPGRQMTLTVTNLQEKQVPGFVAVEVAKDPALQGKIAAKSPLSIPSIIGDAANRLVEEQKAADTAQKTLNKELDKIGADDVKQVFDSPTAKPDDDDDDDDEPYVPPTTPETPTEPTRSEILELVRPTPEQLTAALARTDVARVIVKNASDALGYGSYAVGDGQTLSIQSGIFTVGSNQTLTVAQTGALEIVGGSAADTTAAVAALQVVGTVTINGSVTNSGSIGGVGTVNFNGNTTNSGSISTAGTMNVNSSLTNNGTINVTGTMNVSGSMTNSGTITILSETSLHVLKGGSLTNNGTINVGDGTNRGRLEIQKGGKLTNEGEKAIITISTTNNGNSQLVNMGTFDNSGAFSVTQGGLFTCAGTYNERRSDQLYAMAENDGDAVGSVSYLGPAATISEWPSGTTVTLLGTASGTFGPDPTSDAGKVFYAFTDANVTLDLNGRTAELNASLYIGGAGLDAAPSLTITDSSSKKTGVLTTPVVDESEQGFDTILVSSGTLTLNGGTVTSTKGFPINVRGGTVNISGGEVSNGIANGTSIMMEGGGTVNISDTGVVTGGSGVGIEVRGGSAVSISGGQVTSTSGVSLNVKGGSASISGGQVTSMTGDSICVLAGTLEMTNGEVSSNEGLGILVGKEAAPNAVRISGGEVSGYRNAIQSNAAAASVIISGTAVITLTNPTPSSDTQSYYAVSGQFTFSSGMLRAKNSACFCDSEFPNGSIKISDKTDSEGYYTATPGVAER